MDANKPNIGIALKPKQYVLFLHHNNELLVGILPDGEIEFGENYRPDTAAKVFWNAVANIMPQTPKNTLMGAAQEVRALLPKDADGYATCQLVAAWMEQKAKTFSF